MRSELLQAAWSISGWNQKRAKTLAPVVDALGVRLDALAPTWDWNTIPLAFYLGRRPLCYHFEPAFTVYYKFLLGRYASDLALFVHDLCSCGQDVWEGLVFAERMAHEVETSDIDNFDDYQKVGNYLNPWYLRLVEQAFDSLLTLPAFRLQTDAGKQLTLRPRSICEAMRKHGWLVTGTFYDPTVRNGIGHDVHFIESDRGSPLTIRYTDANGNSVDWPLVELQQNVLGLVDECLAYCFALRLFLFENRGASELQPLLQPTTENFAGRELCFRSVAGSYGIK